MKKSEFRKTRRSILAMQPTPRRGVLDEEKKANVLLLIASGLSRREAAGYVQCAHTTIGRTAARDGDFATKLAQAEANSHVAAVSAIRGAMRDPKYWRAAAWMLERRSPEEYARRDPNSFTADQVMSLLARLYSESLPLLPEEKVQQFQELFDEALDEVEAKSSRTERPDDSPGEPRTHLAPRDGLAARNGHVGDEAVQPPAAAAPSGNGHPCRSFLPERTFADEAVSEPASVSGSSAANVPLGKGDLQDGRSDRAKQLAEMTADLDIMATAQRFVAHAKSGLDGDGPLFAALMRKVLGRAASSTATASSAQMHHPFQQGAGERPADDDRNSLCANELQQMSTECTKAENTAGRCNNELVYEGVGA